MASRRYGFSLVELSIVLVILGLLTGGILAGQSLIRAAELRSYGNDMLRYQAAVHSFRDKYFALPGDMNNATAFWGVLAGDGNDATCQNTAATGLPTCNGNGDGRIYHASVSQSERFRAWQHLANAGLVEGSYTGKTTGASGSMDNMAGVNAPLNKGNATFTFFHSSGGASPFLMDAAPAGIHLEFRAATSNTQPLTPEENWNIDMKYDDGKPGYGIVQAAKNSWPASTGCTTTDDSATSEYSLTNPGRICRFNYCI